MKRNFKFASLALGAMMAGVLGSCTAESGFIDQPEIPSASPVINLVKETEVNAYSRGMLINPLSNAGDGYVGNQQTWNKFNADELQNITDDERRAVLAAIEAKVTGARISEDVVFPWENYFLQDVISGQNGNFTGAGSNGTSSSSYSFEAWNTGSSCNSPYWKHCNDEIAANYEEVTNSAHLNNYYQKVESDGSQTRINETSLMTDMKYGTYEEMKGKQFRWYINCHENLHWYEYIVVQVDGNYYICFDFGCGHPENDVDGNSGKGAEHNDWDYNDWILKITPAGPHQDVWTGEEPKDETCDKCPHHKHDGKKCPECEEGTVCNPEDKGSTDEPTTPEVVEIPDHVEVNLEVEEHQDYLATHLSIHVRAVTDVEVFIPVPVDYYVEADDMAIVQKHETDFMVHGGPIQKQWLINGQVVTLTVTFESNGIRVTTDGINDKVIDYLKEEINDGLTFEVWNYYNADKFGDGMLAARHGLKEMIDGKSTVKFLDKEPSLYVNAFYYDDIDGVKTENKNQWDCTVEIVESQAGDYKAAEDGEWYNGSPFNQLREKKSAE